MASFNKTDPNIIEVSENILISVDENNLGEAYIFDDKYRYILNGMTASELIMFFDSNDDSVHLSEEILDMMMSLTINTGTH